MTIVALTAEFEHAGSLTEVRAIADPRGVAVSPVAPVGPNGLAVSHLTGSVEAVTDVLTTLGIDPAAYLVLDLDPRPV